MIDPALHTGIPVRRAGRDIDGAALLRAEGLLDDRPSSAGNPNGVGATRENGRLAPNIAKDTSPRGARAIKPVSIGLG